MAAGIILERDLLSDADDEEDNNYYSASALTTARVPALEPMRAAHTRKSRGSVAYGASGSALVFDPRRASWQPLRTSSIISHQTQLYNAEKNNVLNQDDESDKKYFLSGQNSINFNSSDSGARSGALCGTQCAANACRASSAGGSGPRLSTNVPRIMATDKWGAHARNIAPKARIIKNVLVLSCTCMCTFGSFYPLRTYLSLSATDLKILAPFSLVLLYLCAALSGFYGAAVARRLTYKLTIALCQIPYAILLASLTYCHYYTILPAVILVGLCQGPLWNAVIAYLINMAAQFAYFSYETQDKMVKRFVSTFDTLVACGWTWGHLLTAGAFNAIENAQNATEKRPPAVSYFSSGATTTCGSRFCNKADVLQFPDFHSTTTNFSATIAWPFDSKIVPVYSISVYAGNVLCAFVLSLFLLDKLKVQLCSQTNKTVSVGQLLTDLTQIFCHQRMRLLLPMFVFIGLEEAFIVCDVMKAYVACTTPQSTVGYVLFSYGLISTFLCAFLCAAVRHIRRVTVLLAGLACQLGSLIIMWMWKPVSDDQPILYVIAASWSMSDSIWKTLCQTMVYQSFPEQWEAPFSIYYLCKAVGLAIGFFIGPFGCVEYKIYFLALSAAAALLPFAVQELQAQKFDWFSSLSPTNSD